MGQRQARELGTALRARYAAALLPPGCTHAAEAGPALAVRSSNVQRTVATAAGVLTGLFPPAAAAAAAAAAAQHAAAPSVHHTPPAPIRVAEDAVEWIFPNFEACARLRALWRRRSGAASASSSAAHSTAPVDDTWRRPWAAQLAALAQAVPPADVAALGRPWGVVELMDHATAREAHGLAPLGAMTTRHVADLRDIAAAVVADVFTGGVASENSSGQSADGEARRNEALRLGVGRLVADVAAALEASAASRSALKLALYSGHDTTLLPLLLALQPRGEHTQPPLTWPRYASHVAIELWAPRPTDAAAATLALTAGGGGAVAEQGGGENGSGGGGSASGSAAGAGAPGAHYVRVLYNFEARRAPRPCGARGSCSCADVAPFRRFSRHRWSLSRARAARRTAPAAWRISAPRSRHLCPSTSARSAPLGCRSSKLSSLRRAAVQMRCVRCRCVKKRALAVDGCRCGVIVEGV